MQMIPKYIITIVVVFFILNGCGGGGSNEGTTDTTTEKNISSTISGSVVDGPIYNATISVYSMEGVFLGSTITSAENGKLGDYSLNIKDLPTQYIIKVVGGRDSGADGVINENDEDSFEMSSIGQRISSTTYVSPATTLITKIVQSGLSLSKAKENIQKALGLPKNLDLTRTDPKSNDIASKAATFVATLVKALPIENNDIALSSIASEFKLKVENNSSVAKIDSTTVSIKDLSISSIADDIKLNFSELISSDDINKLSKVESVLHQQILKTVKKSKAFNNQNDNDRKEVLVAYQTFKILSRKIEEKEYEEIDSTEFETLSLKLEEGFAIILSEDISNLTNDNLDIVSDVIAKNIDEDISSLSEELKLVASQTSVLPEEIKNVLRKIYQSIEIEEINKMSNLELSSIERIVVDIDTSDEDKKEFLENAIASKLSQLISVSTDTITADKITTLKEETILNDELTEKLGEISSLSKTLLEMQNKGTISKNDKAKLKTYGLVLKNINKNMQRENFEFTEATSSSVDNLIFLVEEKLKEYYNDSTKSDEDITSYIHLLNISMSAISIETLNESSFSNTLIKIKELMNFIKVKKDNNINIDLIVSYLKIENKLNKLILNNHNLLENSVLSISNEINDYIVLRVQNIQTMEPPLFPTIGKYEVPAFLTTNGK